MRAELVTPTPTERCVTFREGVVAQTSSGTIQAQTPVARRSTKVDERLENAIYSQIQALRALGRTRVETEEIGKALGVSVEKVNKAIASLRKRGVRLINR